MRCYAWQVPEHLERLKKYRESAADASVQDVKALFVQALKGTGPAKAAHALANDVLPGA
jgi:hypothetical protein